MTGHNIEVVVESCLVAVADTVALTFAVVYRLLLGLPSDDIH